jgi:mRNA interferase RelE/StbE
MYSVIILLRVEKFLKGLAQALKNRLLSAMMALAADPRPPGCIKVKSEDGVWRIRVGDYRIGYIIDDTAKTVTIVRIGHRSDFYD